MYEKKLAQLLVSTSCAPPKKNGPGELDRAQDNDDSEGTIRSWAGDNSYVLVHTLYGTIYAALNDMPGDLWNIPVACLHTEPKNRPLGCKRNLLTPHLHSGQWLSGWTVGERTGQFAHSVTNQSQLCIWFLKPEVPTGNFLVSFEVSSSALPQATNLMIIFFRLNDDTRIQTEEPDSPPQSSCASCFPDSMRVDHSGSLPGPRAGRGWWTLGSAVFLFRAPPRVCSSPEGVSSSGSEAVRGVGGPVQALRGGL